MKIPPPPKTSFAPQDKQAPDHSLSPRAALSPRRSRRTLRVLLAFLALAPIGLLVYGLLQEQNATRMVVDANRSGSLRYKSLWIYAVTNAQNPPSGQKNDGSWQAVHADMAAIRRDLSAVYPGPVARTDMAWAAFDTSLRRAGSVDWQTAEAMRVAANGQTQRIVQIALDKRNDATIILMCGMASVLLSACVGFHLLRKLSQAEARLSHEHAFMEAVLQTAGALVVVVDAAGHIVRFNRACEALSGYEEGEVVGKIPWEFLIPPEEVTGVLDVFGELRSGVYPSRYENQWLTRGGARRRIAWTNTALTNGAGIVDFVIGTGIDITERHDTARRLSEANDQLATLALQDGLTGLANRRALDARLREACHEATRYNTPLSLLILDVDHFKRFNDRHGHLAGDAVLQSVGEFLKRTVRGADFVARYGGEEFVVVLPQTNAEAAFHLAQRICQNMEAAPISPHRTITASVGAATWTPAMSGPDDLIDAADHALYFGKKRRNTAVHIESAHEIADIAVEIAA